MTSVSCSLGTRRCAPAKRAATVTNGVTPPRARPRRRNSTAHPREVPKDLRIKTLTDRAVRGPPRRQPPSRSRKAASSAAGLWPCLLAAARVPSRKRPETVAWRLAPVPAGGRCVTVACGRPGPSPGPGRGVGSWWARGPVAVRAADERPPPLVHVPVAPPAQQAQIIQIGRTQIDSFRAGGGGWRGRWASHQATGALHLTHPPSRTASARRCAGVTVRVERPASRICDRPLVITRHTPASQASRLAASPEIAPNRSSCAAGAPGWPSRVDRSTTTVTCGRTPPTSGSSP